MKVTHKCYADGCHFVLPSNLLMCRKHWYMVPKPIRDSVWRLYREVGEGHPELHAAHEEARKAVALKESA